MYLYERDVISMLVHGSYISCIRPSMWCRLLPSLRGGNTDLPCSEVNTLDVAFS